MRWAALLVASAVSLLVSVARAELNLPEGFVPINVRPSGAHVGRWTIEFCELQPNAVRASEPAKMPMFRNWVEKSSCSGVRTRSYHLDSVKEWLEQTRDAWKEKYGAPPPTVPSGMVFHQARVGSTLFANMLAHTPKHVVYSESAPPATIMLHSNVPEESRVEALRVVVEAMGRMPGAEKLFFKFQSALSAEMAVARKAFPDTPFVYLQREPVEAMASLLRTADDASRQVHRGGDKWHVVGRVAQGNTPCTRYRRSPPALLMKIGGFSRSQAKSVSQEQFCASHLAYLDDVARSNLEAAEGTAGNGVVLDYADITEGVIQIVETHFKQTVSDEDKVSMRTVAGVYSKGYNNRDKPFESDAQFKRNTAPGSVQQWAKQLVSKRYEELNKDFGFQVEQPGAARGLGELVRLAKELVAERDSEARQLRQEMASNNDQPSSQVPTKAEAEDDGLEEYPRLYPLVDMLDHWNPDDPNLPSDWDKYHSIRVFEWSAENVKEAAKYRRMELPFVLRGVPNLLAINKKWTDDYLLHTFAGNAKTIESSTSNHFMFYYKRAKQVRDGQYERPTQEVSMLYKDWLGETRMIEKLVENGEDHCKVKHYYWTVSTRTPPHSVLRRRRKAHPGVDNSFIYDDYEIFRNTKSFFVVDPAHEMGVHCRFGQPGIIAEDHFDAGRNFITMVRGTRRYILAPPSECANLDMLRNGPSARHSKSDWSNPEEYKQTLSRAKSFEVVLTAGDALYLPAWWFHLPISLTTNIQCNARSGSAQEGIKDLHKCGFPQMRGTEGQAPLWTPVKRLPKVENPPPAFPKEADRHGMSEDFVHSTWGPVVSVDGDILVHSYPAKHSRVLATQQEEQRQSGPDGQSLDDLAPNARLVEENYSQAWSAVRMVALGSIGGVMLLAMAAMVRQRASAASH